jgi:hypothetical protein
MFHFTLILYFQHNGMSATKDNPLRSVSIPVLYWQTCWHSTPHNVRCWQLHSYIHTYIHTFIQYIHTYKVHVRMPTKDEDSQGRYWKQTCLCSLLSWPCCLLWDVELRRFVVRHRRFGVKYHSHLQKLSSTTRTKEEWTSSSVPSFTVPYSSLSSDFKRDNFILKYHTLSMDIPLFPTDSYCRETCLCSLLSLTVRRQAVILCYHSPVLTTTYCHATSHCFLLSLSQTTI